MSTLRIYADNVMQPTEPYYGNGSSSGAWWHDYANADPQAVRQATAAGSPEIEKNWEAAGGYGNLVTDWYDGSSYNGLARSIMRFYTAALAGYTWDSIKLGLAPSEAWSTPVTPAHLLKMTGVSLGATRPFSDYDIIHYGSNVNQYTDRLSIADSAGSVAPAVLNQYAFSGPIDEAKLPMDAAGYTIIGLLADSDVRNQAVSSPNVNHFWGPDSEPLLPDVESLRPYLLVEGAVLTGATGNRLTKSLLNGGLM